MDGVTVREVLLERDDELTSVRDSCRRAASGSGGFIAIRGAAGIGKTTILEATRYEGGLAGLMVLTASGAELERDLAFGVVRQLFERSLGELTPGARAEILDGAAGLAVP